MNKLKNLKKLSLLFFILLSINGCSIFNEEKDEDFVKRHIVLGILNEPDKALELMAKNPLKDEEFVNFTKIPNIIFYHEIEEKQLSVPFNELIKNSTKVEIFCDSKYWVYGGGGYFHVFKVHCLYNGSLVTIRFTFKFKNNSWVFRGFWYDEQLYCH